MKNKTLNLLFATDSFKGTLSSKECAEILTETAQEILGEVNCTALAMADGGEGTTLAVLEAVGGQYVPVTVNDPLMRPVQAYYGRLDKESAIMEMAAASGLPLLTAEERNPLLTSTYGTGELIRHALDQGVRRLYIAIGGSATNDGGIGCLRALGVRFLDSQGAELTGTGGDLQHIETIDTTGLDPRLAEIKVTVMCDVNNPLCGPRGATHTFGPQKGATPERLAILEQGMCHYRDKLKQQFGCDPDQTPGSGAAGGLGAALLLFLNAHLQSGIETVLQLTHFDDLLAHTDLVVTGEGHADGQSVQGKVMQGIGLHCKQHNVPAVALVGGMAAGAEKLFDYGIDSILTTVADVMPLSEVLAHAHEAYRSGARRLFRLIKVGMKL